MTESIGIVGAGIAALQLALYLHRRGVEVALYADRTPDQIRSSRLPNTVCRFGPTQARERALGVAYWDDPAIRTHAMDVAVVGTSIAFRGKFAEPGSFVDMRLYQATLLANAAETGVHVEFGALQPEDVQRLAARHALVVIASGRGRLADLFPRRAAESPYTEPQRRLFAGLFRGVRGLDPPEMVIRIVPDVGEVFIAPFFSFAGFVHNVLVEAPAGSELEWITQETPGDALPGRLLEVLRTIAPGLAGRIDEHAFALTGERDFHRGAITPVVREGYVELAGGVHALAIGDANILNDPIMGQGANAASHAASVAAEAILAGGPFDAAFCRGVQDRIWAYAANVTEWSNSALQPPLPHVMEVFHAAADRQEIADAIADNFGHPERAWAAFGSPEGAARFLESFERAAA